MTKLIKYIIFIFIGIILYYIKKQYIETLSIGIPYDENMIQLLVNYDRSPESEQLFRPTGNNRYQMYAYTQYVDPAVFNGLDSITDYPLERDDVLLSLGLITKLPVGGYDDEATSLVAAWSSVKSQMGNPKNRLFIVRNIYIEGQKLLALVYYEIRSGETDQYLYNVNYLSHIILNEECRIFRGQKVKVSYFDNSYHDDTSTAAREKFLTIELPHLNTWLTLTNDAYDDGDIDALFDLDTIGIILNDIQQLYITNEVQYSQIPFGYSSLSLSFCIENQTKLEEHLAIGEDVIGVIGECREGGYRAWKENCEALTYDDGTRKCTFIDLNPFIYKSDIFYYSRDRKWYIIVNMQLVGGSTDTFNVTFKSINADGTDNIKSPVQIIIDRSNIKKFAMLNTEYLSVEYYNPNTNTFVSLSNLNCEITQVEVNTAPLDLLQVQNVRGIGMFTTDRDKKNVALTTGAYKLKTYQLVFVVIDNKSYYALVLHVNNTDGSIDIRILVKEYCSDEINYRYTFTPENFADPNYKFFIVESLILPDTPFFDPSPLNYLLSRRNMPNFKDNITGLIEYLNVTLPENQDLVDSYTNRLLQEIQEFRNDNNEVIKFHTSNSIGQILDNYFRLINEVHRRFVLTACTPRIDPHYAVIQGEAREDTRETREEQQRRGEQLSIFRQRHESAVTIQRIFRGISERRQHCRNFQCTGQYVDKQRKETLRCEYLNPANSIGPFDGYCTERDCCNLTTKYACNNQTNQCYLDSSGGYNNLGDCTTACN